MQAINTVIMKTHSVMLDAFTILAHLKESVQLDIHARKNLIVVSETDIALRMRSALLASDANLSIQFMD